MTRRPEGTVVLVSGTGCDDRLWRPVIAGLPTSLPIMTRPSAPGPSIAAAALDLLGAIDGPLLLAGHSLGALVALEACLRAPDRVLGLAMLSTSARQDAPEQRAQRLKSLDLLRAGDTSAWSEAFLNQALGPGASAAVAAICRRMLARAGPRIILAQQTAVAARGDFRARLSGAACPALVLTGAADSITPFDHALEIALLLPDARGRVVPGAGHMLPLEAPTKVAHFLGRWIGRCGFEN